MNKELRIIVVSFLVIIASLCLTPLITRAVFGTYNPYYIFRDSVLASLLVLVWVGIITLLVTMTRIYRHRSFEDTGLKKILDSLTEIQEKLKTLSL